MTVAWEDIQDAIDKWATEELPGKDASEARACIMSWSDLIAQAIATALASPPPVEPAQSVTEAMVEAVWGELAVRCSTTPGRDAVRYALRAALATSPEGSGGANG